MNKLGAYVARFHFFFASPQRQELLVPFL